jgi:hypothetical protein
MKKLLFVALAICALGVAALPFIPRTSAQGPIVGPGNLLVCTKIATIPPGGPTTITQLIAGVAGQGITICGWHVTNTAASGTFSFSYGTGSNCGTGTQTPFPAQSVSSTAPSADHIDYGTVTIPAGNALCYTFSVATIAGIVYYTQF